MVRPQATLRDDCGNGRDGWKCHTPDSSSLRCPCFKTDRHTSAARIAAWRRGEGIPPAIRLCARPPRIAPDHFRERRLLRENFADPFQSLTPPKAGARNPFDLLITHPTGR